MTERRRASAGQQARRINAAAILLGEGVEAAEAARQLARRFQVSERQARRYVDAARARGTVAVPEPTVVFTVRLPAGLVARLRRHARTSERTLSSLVAEACEGWLERTRRGPGRG